MKRSPAAVIGFLLVASFTSSNGWAAQPTEAGAIPDEVQVDALQCWRDVRSRSVRVGQPFTMTITCAAVETDAATTVPEEVGLAPETIDLAPFEVIEGRRFEDVRDGPWRLFQYQYTLRVINEELFGQDTEIPELELRYHIERRLDGGSLMPGRQLQYIVPAEPIRILSLVPEEADDVRGLPPQTFGDADERLFRANAVLLAAAAAGVVALGFLGLAAIYTIQEWRGSAPKSEKLLPQSTVVHRALRELTALQRASQEEGWTDELVGRALTALRLAGAAALSAPIAQERIDSQSSGREGQLRIRRGVWRPATTAVSASVTPGAMSDEIEQRAQGPGPTHPGVADLRDALQVFTSARYSSNGDTPTDRMTSQLDKGIGVVRQLRYRTLAPVQTANRLIESTRQWWSEAWTR